MRAHLSMKHALLILLALSTLRAADYRAPAGNLPAVRRPGAAGVLPGGRIIAPLGLQYVTGPGTWGLALSPNAKYVVTSDSGPRMFSLTILEKAKERVLVRHFDTKKKSEDPEDDDAWRSVFMGLAFDGTRGLYASEGNSGRVRLLSVDDQTPRYIFRLNEGGYRDSFTGDLAFDSSRGLLYVLDQANFRLVVIDTRARRIVSSVRVGRLPFALALSPDGKRAYVTNLGVFEYRTLPGADPKLAKDTGLSFPAFGFPSPEAEKGVRRERAIGPVDVPGLGSPNVPQSNSLCVVNVENPEAPKVEAFIRTGRPFGPGILGGSSPSGVLAAAGRIFVSNGHNDSITVISAATLKVEREIELRIPGLDQLRGILPLGMAYQAQRGWLLVAEAGINAVGVIDAASGQFLGHLPVSWFPTRVAIDEDNTVYVANAKGQGTGPNADQQGPFRETFQADVRRGSLSVFPLPDADDLAQHTRRVLESNGMRPAKRPSHGIPPALRYVVLIVKENRTFDEVFGDVDAASNGPVNGAPMLARFGRYGVFYAPRGQLRSRLNLRNVNVTPNHHEMVRRWAMSDNFYADSEVSVDGHHWLVGAYPDAWTQSTWMSSYGGQKDYRAGSTAPGRLSFPQSNSSLHPEEYLEAGAIWHHLERFGIPFRNYGEGLEMAGVDEGAGLKPTGARYLTNMPLPDPLYRNTSHDYPLFNMNIPDQYRASQFIDEVEAKYIKGGEPLPRFIYIHLPNDHMAKPRPADGYPFEASYVADNDYALGRILQFLSNTPWWKEMAVFVTEDDAQGGVDHVDSHRTLMMISSPYARRNYVSHVHSSVPGLLKTAFRILGLPPLNLFDATASDLSDCFTLEADFEPYRLQSLPPELFDPLKAREAPEEGTPVRMDDPAVLREQHRRQ